jgi:hypothetical protein
VLAETEKSIMVLCKARARIGLSSRVSGIVVVFMITSGLFLFAPSTAFAATPAGGACPTGANYLNASGQLVTLSSLGITSCFFVSKSLGSDANNGLSERAPWQHLPGTETTCSGNCAAATPTAGQGFILYGGDTWPNSDLGIYWHKDWSGTSSNPIYIGVDLTWYSSSVCGSSWCRPIWSCQGAPCADVANTGNPAFFAGWGNFVILDNIEMSGLHTTAGQQFEYVLDEGANDQYQRLYVHGWSHAASGDSDNAIVFSGAGGNTGTCFHDNVVDGSDTSEDMIVALYSTIPCAYNNYISYVTNGMEAVGHDIHDNTIANIVPSFMPGAHQNHLFHFGPDNGATSMFVYNNLIYGSTWSGGVVGLWLNGNEASNGTVYAFNNIFYDLGAGNNLNTSGHNSTNYGTFRIFNNTFECGNDSNNGGCGGSAQGGPIAAYYAENNYWVSSTPITYCYTTYSPCSITTDLVQNITTANNQGYTSTESYAFAPTSATGGTVGAGTNNTSTCATIAALNVSAGAACQLDTTYGVGENTINHTVAPNRTPIARPSNGAWDVGAYQYGGGNPPNPPTGLKAVVK